MSEKFDKKAFEKEIDQLGLTQLLDRKYELDELVRTPTAQLEVVKSKLKRLAMDRFAELPMDMDSFEESSEKGRYLVTRQQMIKADVSLIHDVTPKIFQHIVKKRYDKLSMSRDDLVEVLAECGVPRQEIPAVLSRVCRNMDPTIKTKRL